MTDFGLSQFIVQPTRFSTDGCSRSVIDLFACNWHDLVLNTEVSDPISDHCCVTVHLKVSHHIRSDPKQKHVRPDFANTDWLGLRTALSQAPLFEAIQGTDNVDVACRVWTDLFLSTTLPYIPLLHVTTRPKNKPWMTAHLHKLTRQKTRLFRAALRSGACDSSAWSAYKKHKNLCNEQFRRAKNAYMSMLHTNLANESNGSHRWWTKAKSLAKISTPRREVPDLKDPTTGELVTTDFAKANILGSYFSEQCTNPMPEHNYVGAPFPLPQHHPSFTFPEISELSVFRKLQRLSPFKSTGDMFITNQLLRETAPVISTSLAYLCNLSLKTTVFPSQWKCAKVTPIFKNRGDPSNPSNYRPVSLLNAIGKVFDALQSQFLLDYLLRNHLISDHQFGFLPGRSTTLQLVSLVHEWQRALDSAYPTVTVFMDFMKAFDRVWHAGLLHKLAAAGLTAPSIAWLISYLSTRTITVTVGSTQSKEHSITAGVPQGSHLGPVLFLVFINDMPDKLSTTTKSQTKTDLYADDALLHTTCSPSLPIQSQLQVLQNAVDTAEDWALSWGGRFGHSKTVQLALGRRMDIVCQDNPLFIEGRQINLAAMHKHLGVILSNTLRWSALKASCKSFKMPLTLLKIGRCLGVAVLVTVKRCS